MGNSILALHVGQTENQVNFLVCPRSVNLALTICIANNIYVIYVAGP